MGLDLDFLQGLFVHSLFCSIFVFLDKFTLQPECMFNRWKSSSQRCVPSWWTFIFTNEWELSNFLQLRWKYLLTHILAWKAQPTEHCKQVQKVAARRKTEYCPVLSLVIERRKLLSPPPPGWSKQIFPYSLKIVIIDISIHVQCRYLQA